MIKSHYSLGLIITVFCSSTLFGCSLFSDDSSPEVITNSTVKEDPIQPQPIQEETPPTFETCKITFNDNLESYKGYIKRERSYSEFENSYGLKYTDFQKNVDFQKVIKDCLPIAVEENNSEAQYNVAYSYKILSNFDWNNSINGFPYNDWSKEYLEYAYWITKAAEQGHVKAQGMASAMYYSGRGGGLGKKDLVEADYAKALKFASKAAAKNDVIGIDILAEMYRLGHGVKKDLRKAFNLYKKGYELGDPDCTWSLGLATCVGEGTAKNYSKGVNLLDEAVRMQDPLSPSNEWHTFMLAEAYEKGSYVRSDMKKFKKNDEKALEYYRLSCDKGYGFGCKIWKEKSFRYKYRGSL